MSGLPTHADTRLELASRALFSWDAQDRSLLARTGHLLTHTRASNSVVTATDGTEIEIAHSALPWSVWGGTVGLRVDPSAGSSLLPGGDPVSGRQADVLQTTMSTLLPDNGSGLIRCHRAPWMDLGGALVDAYFLGLSSANPRLAVRALAASRTIRAELIDSSGTGSGAETTIPAGAVLTIAFQWRLLSSAPAVRLDVGAGFGSWSTAAAGFASLTDGLLALGDAAHTPGSRAATGLCRVRLWAGHLTLAQLMETV